MEAPMPRVLIPLAEGCEEMEAVILIDTFRRAEWDVVAAGVSPSPITGSRGVRLLPDVDWDQVDPSAFDLLVLPGGGPGTSVLRKDPRVLEAIRLFDRADKPIAAICAAPLALQEAGILRGRAVTCHPSAEAELTDAAWVDDRVVEDGDLVTSQGPGTAFEFALHLIARYDDPEKARAIGAAMVIL
jgi:4-methyl-5(b-hydroxyethyl)-thiazole monophosphate biosynthesis